MAMLLTFMEGLPGTFLVTGINTGESQPMAILCKSANQEGRKPEWNLRLRMGNRPEGGSVSGEDCRSGLPAPPTSSPASGRSGVTASRSSDVSGGESTPNSSPASQGSTDDSKKSWRKSVIAARQAFPQDAWEIASNCRNDSISGRRSRRQSLLHVAAVQSSRVKSKQDVYETRRASMLNPVSLVSSVGIAGAVVSENYYQQAIVDLRRQEKARRLREAMTRSSADPISDAATKHSFFQMNVVQQRKKQEAGRRQATIGAMIQASLPANVTRACVPPPLKNGYNGSRKSRMPHGPLIVPGANYIPDSLV